MATAAIPDSAPAKLGAGRRFEDLFFSGMALLILASVFFGFARTYFLAGVFKAPLPNLLIHVHGAVFTSWILLLITQISLVSAGRVDLHRRLGLFGFCLACLMVVLGLLAATDALRRGFSPQGSGIDPKTFYAIPLGDMLIFSTLIFFAFRARSNPPAHKRLILIGTVTLLGAAVGRWPLAIIQQVFFATDLICYSFLLLLVLYDLWSVRKVHRATILGSIFLIVVQQLRMPIGSTVLWHSFANWVFHLANSLR